MGYRRNRIAPAWFVCYSILNYAGVDVSKSVTDVVGSTKLRAVTHQRLREVHFVDLRITMESLRYTPLAVELRGANSWS